MSQPERVREQCERWLVLMKGHPASGKSTLARALAQQMGWALLDKDDIKDELHDVAEGNALSYQVLWRLVERMLSVGMSVVVDTPLSSSQSYETGQRLAQAGETRLLVVEAKPPEAVWRQRLTERSPHASQHKIASWADMQQLLERYDGCWRYPIDPSHHIVVDSSQRLDIVLPSITTLLERRTQETSPQLHT